jgi:hypothetical protein
MNDTTMIGGESGRMMCQKVRKKPAPSIVADLTRDDHALIGNEAADPDQREQEVGASEADLCECVAIDRADGGRNQHGGKHGQHRVEKVAANAGAVGADASLAPGTLPCREVDAVRERDDRAAAEVRKRP